MKTFRYILYYFSTMISLIEHVKGLPADYCLSPPNLDDCKGEPQQVFSYYKSGSRCEIETWRGCPSLNIFENENECSHNCIGRLWDNFDDSNNDIITKNYQEDSVLANECEETMNTEDCQRGPFKVYTYDAHTKTCINAEWKGCETKNKFDDEESCKKKCGVLAWEEKLDNLSETDAKEIDKILDSILESNDTEAHSNTHTQTGNKLKHIIEHKPEVNAEEEEEVVAEEITEESETPVEETTEEKHADEEETTEEKAADGEETTEEKAADEEVTEEPVKHSEEEEDGEGKPQEIVTT